MMDISVLLEPVSLDVIDEAHLSEEGQIGNNILIYREEDKFPNLKDLDIALVGVPEDRNSYDNEGCSEGPDKIRAAFYKLFDHWSETKIIDIGNVKRGHRVEDTYYALNQVILTLMRHHITPIILGGSQDLTLPIYQVYEHTGKLVNISTIDPRFDIGKDDEEFNSRSYLSRIIMHQPNYLFNYTNIGYQTYYVDNKHIKLMKDLLFDIHRVGEIKSCINTAEPLLRNADILSIDISAFKASDAPGVKNSSPNGFNGEEGCKMTRYAGLNSKLSLISFFEYNPRYDCNSLTANMIAQMIWYFVEGFSNRKEDYPDYTNSENFRRYIVKIDGQNDELVFLCHKLTEKWWIDLSFRSKEREQFERHHFIPCSKEDYDTAMHNDIPDTWWQYYQKLM